MKRIVLTGWLVLWAGMCLAAKPLPDAELHRLASYLAYITVGVETQGPGGGSLYTVGANCPECNGVGKVGDGVTMLTCEWEDGLYYCNKGKIAKRSDGDAMDVCEVGCALCESVCDCGNCDGNCGGGCCDNCTCPTPKRDELFDDLANAPKRADESYVLYLERQLQEALEESGMGKQECPDCPTCADPEPEEPQPADSVQEPSSCVITIVDMGGSRWNVEGRWNFSAEFIRDHLRDVHNVDTSGMTKEQMVIVHDNIHNGYPALGIPQTSTQTTSNCPSGTCPLPGSASSGSCPTCPGSSSSRFYSRGLFGRRR